MVVAKEVTIQHIRGKETEADILNTKMPLGSWSPMKQLWNRHILHQSPLKSPFQITLLMLQNHLEQVTKTSVKKMPRWKAQAMYREIKTEVQRKMVMEIPDLRTQQTATTSIQQHR